MKSNHHHHNAAAAAGAADSAADPQAGAGRPLPKKESDLFKNVVKHYEMKQYKKAVKQADAILKKFPNHGETLAMKGLTLNYMVSAKRDEAHGLVKQGLMNDMRSHVCWHVYGLLHRSDHNYAEAIKAYKQALRIDAENLQILRDLSMLQIQMRDAAGFAVTRNTLLTLKPNSKINWMAFALARHMSGDLRGAVNVIDIYLGTLTEGSVELGRCFESSELALYKNSILGEIENNHREALDHLAACEGIVVDRGALLWRRAYYQVRLRDWAAARQTCRIMFLRGMTENYRVHSLFQLAVLEWHDAALTEEALKLKGTKTVISLVPLSAEQKDTLSRVYRTELCPQFTASQAVHRIPLTLLDDPDELREALDARCRRDLTRGVPSLCSELLSFLFVPDPASAAEAPRRTQPADPVDVRAHGTFRMFCSMADEYVSNLELHSKFSESDDTEEPPSTLLWAWYLRACLHERAAEYAAAMDYADKCLDHTPTAVDVYELKARLLKLSGRVQEAATCLDAGRDLDRQDRYINNMTVRYFLQAGREQEALKRISLFTRHEGNPEQNLFDMQCSWYELELADQLKAKQEWGRSLKKYSAVVKHFDDFHEDQFDFHAYCLRKVTLRAYVSVLRFEDVVYDQDYYCRAAAGIVRVYLHLYDHPAANAAAAAEPDYSNMTASERKRAKAIARKKKKAAQKKKQAAAAAATHRVQVPNHPHHHQNNGGHSAAASHNKKHQQQQHHQQQQQHQQKGGGGGGGATQQQQQQQHAVEQDPLGEELLKKDPLEEAKKYSHMLTFYAPWDLQTWILQYDVTRRRKKVLMALQALHKAVKIDKDHHEVFARIVHFCCTQTATGKEDGDSATAAAAAAASAAAAAAKEAIVRQVVNAETPSLLDGHASVTEYVLAAAEAVRSDPSTSLPKRVAVAKALMDATTKTAADGTTTRTACNLILYASSPEDDDNSGGKASSLTSSRQVTVETCRDALRVLQSFGDHNDDDDAAAVAVEATKEWTTALKERFPQTKLFDDPPVMQQEEPTKD